MEKSIKTLSLFTGAGGLDIGFHQVGFDIFGCVEIDPTFCTTLELNKPKYYAEDCQIINKDIRLLNPAEIHTERCDFIIGGPPCQSFSAAGRRAGGVEGVNDHRGSLFEHYCRFIEYFMPTGFLFENVRGILSANKRRDWEVILSTFSDLGYQIAFRVLDAVDYGVPQHRERVILVGTKKEYPLFHPAPDESAKSEQMDLFGDRKEKDKEFLFPWPTHGPDSKNNTPYVSCGEAIADLQDPKEPYHEYKGKYGHLLGEIPPGQNYLFFTREFGYPNPIFAWRSRFSDFLYKAHPDQTVKTIVAHMGAYSGPFHWKNRKFTVQEFKRLFSFPDDYKLAGRENTAVRQLGNSVVPLFAEQLAKAVLLQVFKKKMDIELLPKEYKLSFDKRKGEKARKTRSKRMKAQKDTQIIVKDKIYVKEGIESIVEEYYCSYPDWKTRIVKQDIDNSSNGPFFWMKEEKKGGDIALVVSRYFRKRFIKKPLLRYELQFQEPIGDSIDSIKCELLSNHEEDVVAAWDAIEYCLNKYSSYNSMMDVFGHFTEPHPIFELKITVFDKKESFLLKFAEYFSDFSRIAIDYPAALLEDLYKPKGEFNFLDTVKWLRSLRFDVRVFETNRTIKPGYFRCCYPFTLHVNKQIFVTWSDHPKGNSRVTV